jgi:UPF0271 protein
VELLELVSSANVACGAHAGDEATMRAVVRAALERGVAIGAHPSFPDRANFGRVVMERSPREIEADVAEQIARLDAIAREEGANLRHVKAHGALYNLAARDRQAADAISRSVARYDPTLAVVGLAGGAQIESARAQGLCAIAEVFADRGYAADGSLLPRGTLGALLESSEEAVAQALSFVERGIGETICLHGDGPHALEFALAIRAALASAGVRLQSAGRA